MIDLDPTETGGGALTLGFVLVLVVLYRDPANELEVATISFRSVFYFLLLPVGGVFAGVYAVIDGPYSTVLLFDFGSYLGVFGLALTFGRLLASDPISLLLWIGITFLLLSVTALVASVRPLVAFFDWEGSVFRRDDIGLGQ
jgi:hypothetical protein